MILIFNLLMFFVLLKYHIIIIIINFLKKSKNNLKLFLNGTIKANKLFCENHSMIEPNIFFFFFLCLQSLK